MALAAPLAAIEKVSPVVAQKLSEGAQAAAGLANQAIDKAKPHAANAQQSLANSGTGSSAVGQAKGYLQQAVDTAKQYLPGSTTGSTSATTGSTSAGSGLTGTKSTLTSDSNTKSDLDGLDNTRAGATFHQVTGDTKPAASDRVAPDVLSSKQSFAPVG